MTQNPENFLLVGIITHPSLQKCRFILEKLHTSFPQMYEKPAVRAMLNVDWEEFLTKMKRRFGNDYYLLTEPLVIYHNGNFLGGAEELISLVSKTHIFRPNVNVDEICNAELLKHLTHNIEDKKRSYYYLKVAIGENVVGCMLFQLYNDLVPLTCDNFQKRCEDKHNGYRGTPIHRIVKNSWIQCGGWNLSEIPMACENYAIPHNRRGVLSMCNEARHRNNSTQFFITLEPTPWMDYKYVAFGQLVQGAEVLKIIEEVPTYYENPIRAISIVNCGEFTLCLQRSHIHEYADAVDPLMVINCLDAEPELENDMSEMNVTDFKDGKYYMKTDLTSYWPFKRYSTIFNDYLKSDDEEEKVKKVIGETETTGKFVIGEDGLKRFHGHNTILLFDGDHVII